MKQYMGSFTQKMLISYQTKYKRATYMKSVISSLQTINKDIKLFHTEQYYSLHSYNFQKSKKIFLKYFNTNLILCSTIN